jgi:hypothetical protein
MLNKIFSYFKSSNSFSETLSKLSLEGNIYKKIIGKEKFQISSECTIYMTIVNESTFDYNLNIHNSDYEFSKGN